LNLTVTTVYIDVFYLKHDFEIDPSRAESAIRDHLGYLINRLLRDIFKCQGNLLLTPAFEYTIII